MNKNIPIVQRLIRALPLEFLKEPWVVADLARLVGIVQWGSPGVFGADEMYKNSSADMAGMYQTPDQIARALVYLTDYEIRSYLEIGVFQGGNFIFVSEYLRRFNPDIQCLGIDPTGYLNPQVKQIIDDEPHLAYEPVTSDSKTGQEFDLVFIDGEHTDAWVRRDWENVGRHAKICMFHDIQESSCPEIVEFWQCLDKDGKKTVEFLDCATQVPLQGIGIIHNNIKPVYVKATTGRKAKGEKHTSDNPIPAE